MKKTAVAVTAAVAMFSAGMAQAASGTITVNRPVIDYAG